VERDRRSLRELGKTVLLTTHYLDEAQALADVRAAAVNLAVKASEGLLKTKLSGEAGSALVDSAIRDLKGKLN